ncbi:YunC family protein [Gracilibacillus xinjiangensis]|uniref:YunC family protein n=1 Tax=Gracilibacillus xinjiangensis TaxID=1193282 RepID=A0ABV8WZW3_9BACI
MMEVNPLKIEDHTFVAITVKLPYTTLLVITNDVGYVMCGALDVDLLNEKLSDRPVVAGRAIGVRTIDDLLGAKLEKITDTARDYGWKEDMEVKKALLLIAE